MIYFHSYNVAVYQAQLGYRFIKFIYYYSTMQTNDSRACTLSADNEHAAFSVAHFLKFQSEYNVTAAWTRR
jgi:hypothetical protein